MTRPMTAIRRSTTRARQAEKTAVPRPPQAQSAALRKYVLAGYPAEISRSLGSALRDLNCLKQIARWRCFASTTLMPTRARNPFPIATITDFGYRDHYVGVMKGVVASIAPGAAVIDITHDIPAQSIAAGALVLRESWRYFPPRTVFLAVVD